MILEDIQSLIQNSESRSIEYKQSMAELEKLGKTICGFLNTGGGIGFIGITDKKRMVGIEVTESTKNKLSSFCNHFDPWPELKIDYVALQNTDKQIVAIQATPRKDNIPFVYKGVPYLRNEAQLKKMPVEMYKQRLLKSAGFSELWESLPTKLTVTMQDLDENEILKTIHVALESERIPASGHTNDIKEALISLDMMDENNKINNAAMVLFAKNMSADYPQCFIRMGRFIDETMDTTLDSKQIGGNAFQLLDEAESFVRKHIPLLSHFKTNEMTRTDELALPFLAVREAIINALVHRDYADRAGDIALLIFNTHLEIHNIGHLYGDMTIAKLKVRHTSRRRNPKIAHVFHIRKLIERYGSGTLRMMRLCKAQGLKNPAFAEAGDGFLVKFYFKEPIGPYRHVTHTDPQNKFSEREKELLNILSTHGQCTLKDIMTHMKKPPTDRTIRNTLSSLRERGMVSLEGIGRGAYWVLSPDKEIIRK